MSDDPLSTDDWRTLTKVLAGLILFPASVLAYGFTLSTLWGWFVTPFGAPGLGLAHALGLAALVSIVTKRFVADDRGALASWTVSILRCGLTLGFGWIFHLLM